MLSLLLNTTFILFNVWFVVTYFSWYTAVKHINWLYVVAHLKTFLQWFNGLRQISLMFSLMFSLTLSLLKRARASPLRSRAGFFSIYDPSGAQASIRRPIYGQRASWIPVEYPDIPNGCLGERRDKNSPGGMEVWRRTWGYISTPVGGYCHPSAAFSWSQPRLKFPHWQPETSRGKRPWWSAPSRVVGGEGKRVGISWSLFDLLFSLSEWNRWINNLD